MSRAEWTAEREDRRTRALASPVDAAIAFRAWRFCDDPELLAIAGAALEQHAPTPDAAARALALAPTPAPDRGHPSHATRRTHESTLNPAELAPVPDDASHRAAWRLAELDRLAREIDDRERRTWRRDWPADPERDAAAAEVWAALFSGNPWGLRDRCEALWLGTAKRSFAGVLAARELPPEVRSQALDDLQEAFFYRLLGTGDSTPGWMEIAVRVVETVGPVIGPASMLSSDGRSAAGACVTQRSGWGRTAASLFADLPDREGRARAFAERIEDPEQLETLLDLHVALRFLDQLPDDRAAAWRLVTQNRGKARGRLRALVSRNPYWLEGLLALDALQARTQAAVARFAWSWAWQEMSRGFSFDAGRPVTPPCEVLPDALAPIADADRPALRTWLLLVVLKGRHGHLERWVRTGGTGDRDSTWARLLTALPAPLKDDDGGYKRVRIHLHDRLDDYLAALRSPIEAIAALEPGRTLKQRALEALQPVWNDAVDLPRSGFPTFVEHARSLRALYEEDPCLRP
jgi:hypothetical protein